MTIALKSAPVSTPATPTNAHPQVVTSKLGSSAEVIFNVKAWLKLGQCHPGSVQGDQLDEINEALSQLRQLVVQLGTGEIRIPQYSPGSMSGLTESFTASIKKAAKPGMTLE